MRVLKASAPGERDKVYDEALLLRMDELQGRRRLCNNEVEMLIAASTCAHLMMEAEEVLQPLAREVGAARRITLAITMLRNALQLMSDKVCGDQLITIANNANGATVTLSAPGVAMPGWVNLRWDTVSQLVNTVQTTCHLTCTKDSLQARHCPLYKALSQIPSLQMAAREVTRTERHCCPYRLLMIEEDDSE